MSITLIDGTINACVICIVSFPIKFSYGYSYPPEFFITKLGRDTVVVLGYSWLSQCNPFINWSKGTLQSTAFYQVCKVLGTTFFQLFLDLPPLKGNIVHTLKVSPDLSDIPVDYHQFADV